MSRPKLSVAMIVLDEETFLPGALSSVADVADEIIVGIDSRTTDSTEQIARAAGCRVHHFDWTDNFSVARNIGLSKVQKDWVLVIDADERLTPWGAGMVTAAMRQPDQRVGGYCFEFAYCLLDGQCVKQDVTQVRLWPNHPQTRYVGRVYEHPARRSQLLKGGLLTAGVGLLHYGGDPQLYAARHKDERNIELLAKQLVENPNDRLTAYLMAHQHRIGGRHDAAAAVAWYAQGLSGELSAQAVAELNELVAA